jgi:molybdopterin-guanine dinucleotide biosynthesis protein A
LASLLEFAADRSALCLACDMPFVSAALLSRLSLEPCAAQVLAPRDPQTGKWEPLFARYQSPSVVPVLQRALDEGERSFQGLFKRLTLSELRVSPAERATLRDWDTPDDVG